MREDTHLVNSHLDCSIKNEIGATNDCSINLAAGKRTASQMRSVHGR